MEWLTAEQQQSWRAWIAATTLLDGRLGRELSDAHGITMADYEILVRLSEADNHWMHMSELAERVLSSRSRLSHQIDRMQKAGLVCRESCPHDKRGQHAQLTEHGWAVLKAAAPDHVQSVRQYVVDAMTPEEFEVLGRACTKIVTALDEASRLASLQEGAEPTKVVAVSE